MRKAFLTIFFVFISHVCGAPNIDFRLGMLKLKSFSEFLNEKFHEAEFSRFIEDLGFRESGNNWQSVNKIGCFGEWQFDESTLKYLGYKKITLKRFRTNPEIFPRDLQLQVLKTLIKVNLSILMDYEQFIGKTINGVVITKAGMIAASHLGGAGSLEKYLDSNGKINRKDLFGTSIYDYLKTFSFYDLK